MTDKTIKLLVIGESGVGKSSLVRRFAENIFSELHDVTVGMEFKTKEVDVNGVKFKLGLWDTAGEERFRSLTPSFYRKAHGAILVYDVTRKDSLLKLELWHTELQNYSDNPNVAIVIVGNKIDKNRAVSREEGFKFARKHRALFIETSAKNDEFVSDAFVGLVEKIVSSGNFELPHLNTIALSEDNEQRSKWSCCS